MTLTCIAIDDEPLALSLICRFIEQTPFLHLAASYSSAVEALKGIDTHKPDLLFLDIQMPELNGMELAKLLNKQAHAPKVIFTTAYNHFALEGYKVDAIDYLLKPFNYEEFLRAAGKARNYVSLLSDHSTPTSTAVAEEDYLFLKVEQHWVKIAFADIVYIESLKDYVKVHLAGESRPVLSLSTLKALEEKLPPRLFMRVHRSFIVSLDKITSVTKTSLQIGETSIQIGDQYKEDFKKFMSRWM
ncbi:two component transcriptional regulator, LytTR family [Filimonas lacunae]|uniref:Two component transcriptional regulator, LytTR family n=1 Tax=Filimonas lacunae TaxID=477680 RepID=A0A173MDS5_9BACT|nr:LytTR family DNA-binding domain-containing protein [Filimonas lacunae]BAV05715.1 two-component system response regulator [Filimonas lacunae]SIT28811.1 two component transcriptional regulator, LytTR family [Filimonas lacunae]